MSVFDIIFIIIFAIAIWLGFKKGLIVELCGIIGVILGIYISYNFSDYIFAKLNITDEITQLISYVLIVVAVLVLVYILAKAVSKLLNLTGLGLVNKVLGAIASLGKYVIITSMFLTVFNSLNNNLNWVGRSKIDESICYAPLLQVSETIFPFFRRYKSFFNTTTVGQLKKDVNESSEENTTE
ncbi:MAG: CvpA family protein [Rikenellaceae bacterium]